MNIDRRRFLVSSPLKRIHDSEQQFERSSKVRRFSFPYEEKNGIILKQEERGLCLPQQHSSQSVHSTNFLDACDEMITETVTSTQSDYIHQWQESVSMSESQNHLPLTSENSDTITEPETSKKMPTNKIAINRSTCHQPPSCHKFPASKVSDRSCPECAAGSSGHIRHIGRWRLLDSL